MADDSHAASIYLGRKPLAYRALHQGSRRRQIRFAAFASAEIAICHEILVAVSDARDLENQQEPKLTDQIPTRRWITEYEAAHPSHPYADHSVRGAQSIDLLLVDVIENCLLEALSSRRFFALSYF